MLTKQYDSSFCKDDLRLVQNNRFFSFYFVVINHKIMKIIDIVEPLEYTNVGQTCYSGYGTYNYLYHNLGFGGSGNGWYLGSIASIQGTFLPNCMIFNITPPAN